LLSYRFATGVITLLGNPVVGESRLGLHLLTGLLLGRGLLGGFLGGFLGSLLDNRARAGTGLDTVVLSGIKVITAGVNGRVQFVECRQAKSVLLCQLDTGV
jgi:hypothetical protein